MISTIEPKVFLNDKIAKKIFKNEKLGKKISARIISDLIGADYEEVYNNIKLSSEEIAFSSLTINSTAYSLYHDNATYFNIEINAHDIESKPKQLESYVYQLYLGQLHSYEDYNKIKKIVQINIDAYDFYGYNEFIYNIFLTEQKHHFIASDSIQIYHLNLDFLRQINYNVQKVMTDFSHKKNLVITILCLIAYKEKVFNIAFLNLTKSIKDNIKNMIYENIKPILEYKPPYPTKVLLSNN